MGCPHCGRDVPVVHRGVLTFCTACGHARAPFTRSVTLAGQPSRLGGRVASVTGTVVLVAGMMVAILAGLLFQAIFPAGFVGWGLAIMIALVTLAVGLGLRIGGRSLQRSGTKKADSVREEAVLALAAHKGGLVTARDVSLATAMPVEEADAFLTALTRRGDEVVLEVNDDGQLFYRFTRYLPEMRRWPEPGAARVATEAAGATAVQDGVFEEDASEQERARARRAT